MTMVAVVVTFFLLVTANSAGYRFGTADQAFYIPAIQHALEPASFPHDAAVVLPQSELLVSDQAIAWLISHLGVSLPDIFLAGYVVACVIFAIGAWRVASLLSLSAWTPWVVIVGLTLRHRIAETGVNTFEGAFHPRVLAFGLGLLALGALLRARHAWAVAWVGLAWLVHPTTALWFGAWIAGAWLVDARRRRWVVAAVVATAPIAAWMLIAGPLSHSLRVMDPAWTAAFASKDYLFPTEWAAKTWAVNAIAPLVIVSVYVVRVRRGLVGDTERALFAGAMTLLAVFVASLPFIAARVALAVQLQTSRVLWPIEFLATVYLAWALVEGLKLRGEVLVGILALAAISRGAYTLRVEHSRPLIQRSLPSTPWLEAAAWARTHTPLDANFLADPGHAWKYDISFRVAAGRDVYLEEVKDAAMATYAREVALRVTERSASLGDFAALTPDHARSLAARYDLDYLIADRPFPFAVAFSNQQFTVYALPRR